MRVALYFSIDLMLIQKMKEMYMEIHKHINGCLVATVLGPKDCMVVPCLVTKEEIRQCAPSFHTDIAVQKDGI